tara:strand:- start:212 stop:940 length:729 start_codon:yes stop_codon:yes gene_type:complete
MTLKKTLSLAIAVSAVWGIGARSSFADEAAPAGDKATQLALVDGTANGSTTAAGASAQADENETQFSLLGGATMASVEAFEGKGDTQLYGGGLSVSRGIRNWLSLGILGKYDARPDVEIRGAFLEGLGGAGHTLFADLQVFTVAASVRVHLDYGPFLRLRPFIGGSLGGQAILYGSPTLFLDSGPAAASSDNEWNLSLLTALEIGVAYRLTDIFAAALTANVRRSDELNMYGISLEFSWLNG